MYQLKKLKSLLLLLCIAVTAKAQLESGKVYRFVNVGKSDRSMAIGNQNNVVASTTVADDYAQLWYASSNGSEFTLRNLANGRYLYSPNATSSAWLTSKEVNTDNSVFTATSVDGNYAIAVSGKGGYNYMHADGSNNIVCWESSNANSQWTITEVTNITSAELDANWEVLNRIDPSASTISTYQGYLETLFEDAACTTLKSTYASMSESTLKNQAAYQNLPEALQNMVLKVRNNSWAEDNYDNTKNDWDADYAKRYRVQLYEPYNEPEAAASALGLNAHTNLNNPTGIFANDREALYVMVEGEIETGASLYLVSYTGNGELYGYNDGYELKQGLNIIPSFGDGNNYCVNYVVHTFDTEGGTNKGNQAKKRKLSDYSNLKIHIEGGYINGYWNKMGDELYLGADGNQGDKAADWDYVEARATQTTVTILGEYITLQFPLNDAVDSDGATQKGMSYYLDQVSVEDVIDEWDKVMLWERLVLGLLDEETTKAEAKKSPYSDKDYVFEYTGTDNDGFESGYEDYYNVHGLSLGIPNSYMYGGWRHCGYNYGTMQGIMVNMLTDAGSHWGPGHEIGHQHQNLLTVNGLTEVTNNLFANVVLWYFGESTSRYNGSDGALSNVLAAFNTEGSDFFTNNIWALTHMYYKLFLYYHVLGHNTKFYPTLFEMLRQDPMSGGYEQNGATSLFHFYKKCCLASGDDLTEFFRAHGFFSVMDNRLVGDYSNSVYTTTQADIDAAIKEVKDLGYDENIAVLFINDATGETIESHKGDNLDLYGETTVCAEVGGYASFNANTTPDYTYSVSGTTVTMEGTGGTGFAIFNEKGEIIAFSDTKTFEVSSECAVAIASGKAEIKAVQADNTIVEAVDVMDTDNAEAKYEALGELLTATADLLTYADADNSKPGFYRASVMENLQQLYDEAQSVYDNKEVASYATTYAALAQEYTRIAALDTDKTPFLPGSTYVLTNKKYPNVSMTLYNNALIASATNMSNSAQQWTFEATDEEDIYYLKNGTNYLGSLLNSTQVGVTTKELASRYKLFDLGKGLWALQCQNDLEKLMSLHCNSSYKIVGWTHTATDNDGSWWYLTATAKDESMLPLYDLQNLVEKTEALVDEMATVQYKGGAIDMSTCTITSNATETGHETKYLTDGNPNTFFHTVWSGSVVNDYHNIVIDLGDEGHSLSQFVLNYSTLASGNVDAPESLTIQGSNDGSSYTDIASLSTLNDGLPTAHGKEYTSSTLGSASQAYRYIRLQVKTATGGKLGSYYYFGLAELSLLRMATLVDAIGDKYQNFVSADAVKTVCDQVYAAQQTIATGSATSDDVAALQAQYDILLAAYENANNVEFNAKKEELLTLIENTTSLISTCGTIRVIEGGALTLSTTSGADVNYLSGTAKATGEGGLSNLYDNEVSTSYTSDWSDTPSTHPYLQVTLPDGQELGKFTFTFTGRNSGNAPTPSTIVVSGSNNGSTFTEIETFTKDGTWPVAANNQTITPRTWTSPTITTTTAYKYLRFTVTAAERSNGAVNNSNGYCHYGISEFGVSRVGETIVTLSGEHGEATKELLLATNEAVLTAQATCDRATTEAQLQSAITALQGQYDALYAAMYPSVEYTVFSNVTGGGVTFDGGESCVGGGTLTVPASLTQEELKAKLNAIVVDGYVAQPITINEGVITVIYNKEYTIYVNGGEGNGRITFNGTAYANEGTFNALQGSFTAEYDLTASDVEGYTKSAVTVDHETGIISVTYTLDKTALEDLIGVTNDLLQACSGFVNSDYVTDELRTNTSAAITAAIEANSKEELTYAEYTAAVSALRTANTTLTQAKISAEAEAAERTELNGQLNTLIAETETLIASCYENDVLKFVNSEFVTEETISAVRALVEAAEAKCAYNGTTASEYRASTDELTTAKEGLGIAIANAEAEAVERNTQRTALNNLITTTNDLITTCGTTPGDATQALIDEVSAAVTSAQAVAEYMGSTVEQLTNATTTLQGQYNVLLAAQQSTAKTELRALIEQTTELIAQCGTVEYTTTIDQVALQTGDQNADFWLSTNAQESSEGAIANLVGIVDEDGFFHSSWSAQVGAAHYLQVAMGAEHALKEFAFSYTTRDNNNGGPHPSTIVVSGSNSTSNDSFVELATINSGLPTNGNTAWNENNENVITASEAYRYLRFTVTASAGTNDCSHGNGEYYFAMARFSLNSISRGYTAELQNTNVTAEQLIEVYQANAAAATFAENSAVQAELLAEKDKLQALYDALLEAATSVQLPVTLTTDANAPVLYVIKTKRDNNPVLQYDESSGMFSVTTAVDGKAIQAFYFMKGDKVEGTQQVYIYPYMAGGKVLAANDVNNGKEKALAMDKGTATYEQWVFVERADGYYNLQPAGTSTYLSNYGGTGNKMGFYSTDPSGDTGSLLMFETTTVEGSYYYLKLKDYYENQVKVASSNIQGGEAVGYYPIDKANAYNSAYSNATNVLESSTATDEEYTNAYDALKVANDALVMNMPEEGKFYRFVSADTKNDRVEGVVYANPEDNKMYWSKGKETSDATAIWTIAPADNGTYHITNLHTGSSISKFISNDPTPLSESANAASFVSLSGDGQVKVVCNGTMHAQSGGAVVTWNTGANDASAWRIVEVEDMSLVQFALTIGQYRHAGLYLNYATVIPEGIKAYVVNASNEAEGVVIADELEGTILPARTAVIVKGNADTYNFKYTTREYDGTEDLDVNLLGGSAYLKYQQVEEEGNLCCVFGQKSGEVGLYKNYVQYINANGSTTKTEGETTTDYTKSDGGTHFKISANKIYYEYKPSAVAGASAFRFRFNSKEEGTTGIDSLVIADDAVIYNLYGQRLTEVVEPGIYIVNGKKMYVSEKMIGNNN